LRHKRAFREGIRYSASMSALFKMLGLVLLVYVAYGVMSGGIYAKSGPGGRTFRRDEDASEGSGAP
jgi:hypothetical protein